MSEAIIVTPVKNSPDTTKQTIEAVMSANGNFDYYVFDDFSLPSNKNLLIEFQKQYNFHLIHLEDITNNPSPNYDIVLQNAQNTALQKNIPLIIIESDVVIQSDTIEKLIQLANSHPDPGMIGAITVDSSGKYNFPYKYEKVKSNEVIHTHRSLSFCCTLITPEFLKTYDFKQLPDKKDWYDIYISRQSVKSGFKNYLAKNIEVLHQPHSSRPWKNLKYTNPLFYYLKKILFKRDRI